ncbi:MAG: LacI family DNA-binding transcriptional regulator, partial [Bacteroidota bacterium]
PDEFESAMQAMQHRVDGMIVMAPELADEDAGAIIRAPGRILFVNTYISSERVNVLNFDNYGGARALTKHLLDLGHRRIALIRGPAGAHDARERARGYRDAMKDAGLTPLADLEYAGDYTQEAGYRAAETILQSDLLPTAIVAANDYCAMGALQALSEAGIAVPKQMALTGFDGITSGRYTQPAITTALVPIRDIGRQAVRRLLNILDGNGEAEHVIVPVDIVTRASTCESEAEFAARDAG